MSGFGGFKMGLKGRQLGKTNVFATANKPQTIPKHTAAVTDEAEDASAPPPTDYTYDASDPSAPPDTTQAVGMAIAPVDEGSEDEFDAFMASVDAQARKDKDAIGTEKLEKVRRPEFEEEDEQEIYFKHMQEESARKALLGEPEDELQYDSDDNLILVEADTKEILPLPDIDHTEITYRPFNSNFYIEHADITALSHAEVVQLRKTLGVRMSGHEAAKPVTSFGHFGFDDTLMASIRKMGFSQPTPIQSQAIPVAMSGRDVIGMAKTGSGKTAAFLFPMIVHIMDQEELPVGEGPIALIVAPTRELVQQIYVEAKRYCKPYGLRVVAVNGGDSKWEQTKALKDGSDVCVATPGRWIDMVKSKATRMDSITYLVLDEADKMFAMGFEPQVKSIINNTRPDRQTLMFSATFKKKVEMLARRALCDPVRVVVGETGEANADITQHVALFKGASEKWHWLTQRLVQFTSEGSVLVFVGKRDNCAQLGENLLAKDFAVGCIHGDLHQESRNGIISDFKKKKFTILVATDIAARGLDISHIKTVINFDAARDIDTHTHRIGRTGRAGEKGNAYTLLTFKEDSFAVQLVSNLESSNQHVPQELLDMAMRNPRFKKYRAGIGMKGARKPFSGRPTSGLGSGSRKWTTGQGIGAESSNNTFLGARPSANVIKAPIYDTKAPSHEPLPTTQSARGVGGVGHMAMRQKYNMSFVKASDGGSIAAHNIAPVEKESDAKSATGGRRKKSRWG